MNFMKHYELEGKHAVLSPSSYHWINYDADRLQNFLIRQAAIKRGTELHALAKECIRLGVKLPKKKKTLNLYVNDAIDFAMTPEQPLRYSKNCFGTADAIAFDGSILRIHDLKTGEGRTHIEQLMIYAALFYLEYNIDPFVCQTILRIYQSDHIMELISKPEEIDSFMKRIVAADELIESLRVEDYL